MKRQKIGEVLVEVGAITPDQLDAALSKARERSEKVGRVLVEMGAASEEKILKARAIQLGVPFFARLDGLLERGAASLIPEHMAREHLAVPLFRSDENLMVGMADPTNLHAIDLVTRQTGFRVVPVMTTLTHLFEAIQQAYSTNVKAKAVDDVLPQADRLVRSAAEKNSVVETVNGLLQEGMARRASDIHLEPLETGTRVRFRVDGMLQEGQLFPKDIESALIARIKILSKLDITETRLPQDGQLRFEYGGCRIDIRVSCLPTVCGEKVVMRVLDSSKALKKLTELGLSERNFKYFSQGIRRSNGIVLVTGPTGSGKTTTLYAALAALNTPNTNIVTLEDPVEYRVPGLNQVQIHAKIGLSFAAGLRSILRQDPNVVLVGEIRDQETAEIAMRAALTGHLVFSTLHTNDAVASIHRLVDMGVEPFLIAASLNGVMAQRLVRRLCDSCKKAHEPTDLERQLLGADHLPKGTYYEAAGCSSCFNIGYQGRFAIHEWFHLTRELKEMIVAKATSDQIAEVAKRDGMATLHQDALEKAARGLTTIAEVIRVTREEE